VEVPDRVWSFDWLIGRGVNVYDGSQWTTYTPEDGLAHEVVSSMGVDGDGRKWFSTAGGVSVLDDNGTLDKSDDVWTTFDMGGLDIAVDGGGKVWIAIRDPWTFEREGVAVWDGSDWRTYDTTNSGLPDNEVNDILVDGEDVKWFATSGGLTKLIENPPRRFLPLVSRPSRWWRCD
jgi:ligand-binding sensor domain-containing protein